MDILIATLEDLKKYRPDLCDLLYEEFLKGSYPVVSKREVKYTEEVISDTNGVQKGDAIRWNYTKEEGIVAGFDNTDGISNIIVRRFNGTKVIFENDPKLFTILEGEERANVIAEREKYVAEIREKKDVGRALIPKKTNKTKTIYDGIVYNEPTRRGSKLVVGDHIRYKLTKGIGMVKGFMRKGGLDRILMWKSEGIPETIIDNPEAYEIIEPIKPSDCKKRVRKASVKAKIGDMIEQTSDGVIGKVIEIKDVGYGIEKIILELEDGSQSTVFNDISMYNVLTNRRRKL